LKVTAETTRNGQPAKFTLKMVRGEAKWRAEVLKWSGFTCDGGSSPACAASSVRPSADPRLVAAPCRILRQ
jgi:hypothetical protein